MSEPFLGEIRMVGFNFAPRGWALCNGQLMSIAQNTALFSLLGTTYGGNGQTTFALPDLRGRAPLHQGQGPGLTPRTIGESSGSEAVTLLITEIPAHTHLLEASSGTGNANTATSNFIASTSDPNTGEAFNSFATAANTTMNPASIGVSGGSQPHENMQPYLCVNFVIALEGIFPSRN
jgi:microcystin-dependent protein